MIKRAFDVVASSLGLVILSPVLTLAALAVYLQDRHSPFYVAERTGRNNHSFRMVKLRSMVVRADKTGVDSTAGDDPRITAIGRLIRRTKIDEIPQLWNVLKGDMSFVGPRPNVRRETALYTIDEQRLLDVRPGITDVASITFADEGDILRGHEDPDLAYNQLIRPWKSRLGLLYVPYAGSLWLDVQLIALTLWSAVDRDSALRRTAKLAMRLGADLETANVVGRRVELHPMPPPGATSVVTHRNGATH